MISQKKRVVKKLETRRGKGGGFKAKPRRESSKIVPSDKTGGDIYLVQGNKMYQLYSQKSPLYGVDEWVFHGNLTKGEEIRFAHKDGRRIPVPGNSNCGYTLIGIAKNNFEAKHALVALGEKRDDQVYVYINKDSSLYYKGESGRKEIFIRIYDNLSGLDNDRWVVISRK